jgi:hypothetical protein
MKGFALALASWILALSHRRLSLRASSAMSVSTSLILKSLWLFRLLRINVIEPKFQMIVTYLIKETVLVGIVVLYLDVLLAWLALWRSNAPYTLRSKTVRMEKEPENFAKKK